MHSLLHDESRLGENMGRHVKGQAWDLVAVVTVAAATTRHPRIALRKPPRRLTGSWSGGDPQSTNNVRYTAGDG